MTTYDGRSASYIPGREVVNKEPPVSKYVVEKLYRVHRERILKAEAIVDNHVEIPNFLLNQTWKKNAEKQKKIEINRNNREIYERLEKLEKTESILAKENRMHVDRIETKLHYLTKLKKHGRLVNLVKIQKENEYMLKRLEKAKPVYTLKECKSWYKHHELYKHGRRSDPTGGHIMHGMKGLLPQALPPINEDSPSVQFSKADALSAMLKNKSVSKSQGSIDTSHSNMLGQMALDNGSTWRTASITSNSMLSSNSTMSNDKPYQTKGNTSRGKSLRNSASSGGDQIMVISEGSEFDSLDEDSNIVFQYPPHMHTHSAPSDTSSLASAILFNNSEMSHTSSIHSIPNILDSNLIVPRDRDSPGINSDRADTEYGSEDDNQSQNSLTASMCEKNTDITNGEDLMLLSSRPFAIPFESKNCLVQVYSGRSYDENLYLKVVTSGMTINVLVERSLPIDKAYEIINAGGHSSQIIHSTDNEDLQTLSTLLINMFKEADDDNSGSLTFDEFQTLMESVELGISPQELRFVITEADENENGVVDYDEFVPLAVDLIQSFRARNRAKAFISQQHVMVDDQIFRSISTKELEETARVYLDKVLEFDSKKYGLIRVPELKKCMMSVTGAHALQENEISMLCEMLPKDQFGRIKYNSTPTSFVETLNKVRFMTMKNSIIESQGSGLQRYLLDLCKDEESRINNYKGSKEKFVPTGIIPCPSLINILSNSSRLSLSRLQVLVIMSEASVLDGMINYFQFIPMVAKCIELMFEPKALRQRAELIEKTDLSPEALLQGMNSDMFEQRLLTLFKSYDIDHNGFLDQNEFIACLESLDLFLTKSEMSALMNTADVEHRGYLKFDEFVRFFQNNLLALEKEKKIRALQSTMHSKHKHRRTQHSSSGNRPNSGNGPIILGNFNNDTPPATTTASTTLPITIAGANNNSSSTSTTGGNASTPSNAVRRIDSHDSNDDDNDRNMLDTLQSIFKLTDPDHTGFISYNEFDSIMKNFSTHSSTFLMDVLLSELTINDDGMIDYNESLATCGDLLKVLRAKASAQEDLHEREKWAEEKSNQLVQSAVPDIQHIVKYMKRKIKKLNEKNLDPATRFLDVQEIIRSPQCGLSKNESHVVLTRLFQGIINTTPMGNANAKSFTFTNITTNNSSNHSSSNNSLVNKFRQTVLSSDSTDSNHMPTQPSQPVTNHHHNHHHIVSMSPRGNGVFPVIALRASAQFSQNPKMLRTNFSTQELFDAVFEARRVMIMRGLLQEVDKTSTRQLILSHLQAELNKKHASGEVALESSYLPVKSCFDVLENAPSLRLNRAQVLFILSWAECFDREGVALEIHKFADHAASIIERLHIPEVMETRAEVISQGTLDDRKVFNGLREKDLAGYIEAACLRSCDGDEDGSVSMIKLRDVLKDIPRLKLNERDIATIIAGLPWIQDELPITEIVAPTITCIRSLFRERMIHRRVSLIATTSNNQNRFDSIESRKIQEESLNHLKQLADKLLNYIKIVVQGDSLVINLPIDQLMRRTSQLLEDSYNTKHHSITLLFRGAQFVPLHNIKSVVSAMEVNSPALGGMGSSMLVSRKQHTTREQSPALTVRPQVQVSSTQVIIPSFIQILMVEDTRLYSGCTLLANVVSADGMIQCHDSVSVKMPSAGLVDEEAAKQFAINLVERIYLERREDGDRVVSLKVNE